MSIGTRGGCAALHPRWADAMADVFRKLVCGVAVPLLVVLIMLFRDLNLGEVTTGWDALASLGWCLGPIGVLGVSLKYGMPVKHDATQERPAAEVERSPDERERAVQKRTRKRSPGNAA